MLAPQEFLRLTGGSIVVKGYYEDGHLPFYLSDFLFENDWYKEE